MSHRATSHASKPSWEFYALRGVLYFSLVASLGTATSPNITEKGIIGLSIVILLSTLTLTARR